MELTGKLKEQVEKTENMEDAKKAIEDAGMKLTDEELDQVVGGRGHSWGGKGAAGSHHIK